MADDTPGADQQPREQVPPSTLPQTPPSVTPLPTTAVEFARYEASGASGPIPSPEILRAYEDLQPGTARRGSSTTTSRSATMTVPWKGVSRTCAVKWCGQTTELP